MRIWFFLYEFYFRISCYRVIFLVFKHNWHEIPRVKEEATKLNINSLDFKIVRQGVHWGLNRIAIVESIDDDDVEKVKKLIDEDTLSNT